jgi:hypothetical protein
MSWNDVLQATVAQIEELGLRGGILLLDGESAANQCDLNNKLTY